MAVINLSGSNPISESYSVDNNTGVLTLTLSSGSTALGQIQIERVRFRAFAEALAELSKSITTDLDARQKSRMMYNVQGKSAEIAFG